MFCMARNVLTIIAIAFLSSYFSMLHLMNASFIFLSFIISMNGKESPNLALVLFLSHKLSYSRTAMLKIKATCQILSRVVQETGNRSHLPKKFSHCPRHYEFPEMGTLFIKRQYLSGEPTDFLLVTITFQLKIGGLQ